MGMLIAQIALLVWGIIVMVRGQIAFSNTKVVRGGSARLVGALIILPLPLSVAIVFAYGMYLGVKEQEIEIRHIEWVGMVIQLCVYGVCLLSAIVLDLLLAKPRKKPMESAALLDEEEERLLEYDMKGRDPKSHPDSPP
jgi:hypothetical protein